MTRLADLRMPINETRVHTLSRLRYTPVNPSANWWPLYGWISLRMSKMQKSHQVGAIFKGEIFQGLTQVSIG
jgi:hypothetical protein